MAERRTFPARGLSMLPAVYPRDVLHVRPVVGADVEPGVLVAYPGSRSLVCHRVLRTEWRGDVRWFEVRGDAHVATEWVPEGALVYVVERVQGRLGTWQVEGPRGRWLRRLALSEHLVARAVRLAAAGVLRRYAERGR